MTIIYYNNMQIIKCFARTEKMYSHYALAHNYTSIKYNNILYNAVL